jgi:hypothetical protein
LEMLQDKPKKASIELPPANKIDRIPVLLRKEA